MSESVSTSFARSLSTMSSETTLNFHSLNWRSFVIFPGTMNNNGKYGDCASGLSCLSLEVVKNESSSTFPKPNELICLCELAKYFRSSAMVLKLIINWQWGWTWWW